MINTKIKNILVLLDFSEASLNALETAIAIASFALLGIGNRESLLRHCEWSL
jgi:hypothetical protein